MPVSYCRFKIDEIVLLLVSVDEPQSSIGTECHQLQPKNEIFSPYHHIRIWMVYWLVQKMICTPAIMRIIYAMRHRINQCSAIWEMGNSEHFPPILDQRLVWCWSKQRILSIMSTHANQLSSRSNGIDILGNCVRNSFSIVILVILITLKKYIFIIVFAFSW